MSAEDRYYCIIFLILDIIINVTNCLDQKMHFLNFYCTSFIQLLAVLSA